MRNLTILDKILNNVDNAIRTICIPNERVSIRPTPGNSLKDISLNKADKRHIAGLMRINHAGEVCAQALYQGQAATAKLENIRNQMIDAANEEIDHLAWCEERLKGLDSRVSILNPLWYIGSFCLGAIAGLAGDKVSLGFVAETERQVVAHLKKHLEKIPDNDLKTKAILSQMEKDEEQHAKLAMEAGGINLPFFVQKVMQLTSKFLTISCYYI